MGKINPAPAICPSMRSLADSLYEAVNAMNNVNNIVPSPFEGIIFNDYDFEAYFSTNFANKDHLNNVEKNGLAKVPMNEEFVKKLKKEYSKKMIKGKKYALKGSECDGFTMKPAIYEFVKELDNVNDVVIDGYIVKRVYDENEETPTIHSLTKNDCKMIGVEFQNGLEICPKNLEWEKVETEEDKAKEEVEKYEKLIKNLASVQPRNEFFNPNDLSTYPCDYNTKRIHRILVKIKNILVCERGVYYNHNRRTFKVANSLEDMIAKLNVFAKNSLYSVDSLFRSASGARFKKTNFIEIGKNIPFRICETSRNDLIIELLFDDLHFDFDQQSLKNKKISDLIFISIV